MAHTDKRRIQLIDPRFQFRMVAGFLCLQGVVTVLFALALAAFFRSELDANLASAHAKVQNLSNLLLPIVMVLSTASFLASTLFITVYVIRLSHRLAGPMFRFRVTLDSISHRVIPADCTLRPDDQFQEVAHSLAAAVKTLGGDLNALATTAASAQAELQQGNADALAGHLESIRACLNQWSFGSRP